MEDGKVVFTPASEGYYKALQWMSEMFAEGLMDPEIFTMNPEQFNSKFKASDNIGCFTGFSPDMQVGGERMEEYTYILPLKGPDGHQQWPLGDSINLGGFAITQQCANPAALIRLYDYLTSDLTVALEWTYGKQDEHWEYVEREQWRVMEENQPEGSSYGEWRQTLSAGPTAPVFMKMEWASELKVLTTPCDLLKTEASEAYLPYTPDSDDIPPIGFDDVERNDKRTLMQVEIDNYIKKFKSNSVMNGIDDAAWQAHLDTLNSLRVDEYVQLWQEFYDAQHQ